MAVAVAEADETRDTRLDADALSAALDVLDGAAGPVTDDDRMAERETLGDTEEERDGLGVAERAFDAVAGKI